MGAMGGDTSWFYQVVNRNKRSLRLDLSLDHELRDDLYLGLTYAGDYAEDARDNALAARLSLKF